MDEAALLRLISEPTRHKVLQALKDKDRTVTELVLHLADEQSNISHHLASLRQAGLVAAEKVGRTQRYRLADPLVGQLLDEVARLAGRLEQVGYTARLGIPTDPAFHGYG